jgi:hypothetical protein
MNEVTQIEHMQAVALQPGDALVVRMPLPLSDDHARRIAGIVKATFPGHEVLVLGGADLAVIANVDRLGAIERKLDQLLAALAADDEEEPRFSLDGQPAGAERDGNQSLG